MANNKEKLEKAANNAYILADFPDGEYQDLHKSLTEQFKHGAQWLLSQPLSERLTEEEKEKIRAIYNRKITYTNEIEKKWNECNILESIFGTDLFTNQTND